MSVKTPAILRALRSACASVLMFSGLLYAGAQTPTPRLSAVPAATAARVALPGSVSEARLKSSQWLGQLPGDTQLQGIALYLQPTAAQDAAMTQLIADQQNPSSPSYHQWLTPAQFAARFGVADADVAVLTAWLQARGFTVQSVAPSRNRIVFSGTSAAVESAFGVTMQRYQRNGRTFFENSSAVQIPVALADVIGGVTGLSSYRVPTPQLRRMALPAAKLTPDYTGSNPSGHFLVPWDFRQLYGINTLISSGFNGTGITIGVIGQSYVDTTQLAYFQQKTGVAVKAPTITLVPNTGVSNKLEGDESESELDLEYSSGSAPGANINFIYTGCTNAVSTTPIDTNNIDCNNNGVFDALDYAIINNVAPILTMSYGGCESEFATAPFEGYLKQSNTQGQTVLISSGDEGSATCDEDVITSVASNGLTVSYPASSQYVTGVGGTTLTSDASTYWSPTNNANAGSAISYIPETSWNDTASYGSISASGGGASKLYAKPTWQAGTGVPADSHRDVPDVAFPANVQEHGYYTCTVDGACTNSAVGFGSALGGGGIVGGTSVAAPNFAAMLAVIEQANGGASLGNVNPILYTLAQGASGSTIFNDITTGNNIVACTGGSTNCSSQTANVNGTMGYSAGVGYDQVTGLGSINAPLLRAALQTVTAKTPTLALSLSANPPTAGAAVTFTLVVGTGTGTATPTGNVQFAVDGANVGSAVALASGVATYTYSGFATPANHTVTANYAGDSNYNAGTASVTVTAILPVPTVTVTPANATIALNSATTFTATIAGTAGTPTGTVQFAVDGINAGSAVMLAAGTATYTYPGSSTAALHTITAAYSGNTTYSAATGTTNLTVGAVPSFTLAATPSTLTVSAGNSGNETLTVSPVNGFTGVVNLTYTVAGPSGATFTGCLTASSSAVNISSTVAPTLALAVQTTAANCSGATTLPLRASAAVSKPPVDWGHTGFAVISAAGLLGCCFLRRRLRPGLLMLFVLTALTVGMVGCSSNSNTIGTTASSPGTYTVTLVGTSGSNAAITASTSFTLIVQ